MFKKLFFSISTMFFSFCVFAQEAANAIIPAKLNGILDQIANNIPSSGTTIMIIAAVLEGILRLWKSDKPLSILHVVASSLRMIIAIGNKIINIVTKIADLLDKVLPQRIKE